MLQYRLLRYFSCRLLALTLFNKIQLGLNYSGCILMETKKKTRKQIKTINAPSLACILDGQQSQKRHHSDYNVVDEHFVFSSC
jgi:hypothetical protein